jgi:hypothetical protein
VILIKYRNNTKVNSLEQTKLMGIIKSSAPVLGIFCISAFHTFALKGQVIVTSDTIYMHDLVQNLRDGGSIFDWNLTQAPDFFPSLLTYFLVSFFTQDVQFQLLLMTFFQMLILFSLFYKIFQTINTGRLVSFLQASSLITVINLFQLLSEEWIYFYTTNNHMASVLLGLMIVLLILKSKFDSLSFRNRNFWFISALVFFGTASTITIVYAITIPVFVLLSTKYLSDKRKKTLHKECPGVLGIFGLIVLPSSIALLVVSLVGGTGGLVNRLKITEDELTLMKSLVTRSLSRNLVSSGFIVSVISLVCLALIFINFVFFALLEKRFLYEITQDSPIALLGRLSVLSLLSSVIMAFASGGIVDEFFLRYFWFAIFLNMLTGLALLGRLHSRFARRSLKSRRVGFLMVSFLLLTHSLVERPDSARGESFKLVANCLNELKSSGVNLGAGVSDYWHGRSVDYLSGRKIRSFVAFNDLGPFFWMTTKEFYYTSQVYNYVLLHTRPDPFSFNLESMKNVIPVPTQSFACDGTDIIVQFYDNNSLHQSVLKSRSAFFGD